MSVTTGVLGTFGAVWASVSAMVKAGLSSGAIQYIASAVAGIAVVAKDKTQDENVTTAINDAMGFFHPETDNVEALTSAIARLSYALEQEVKARELRDATKKQ